MILIVKLTIKLIQNDCQIDIQYRLKVPHFGRLRRPAKLAFMKYHTSAGCPVAYPMVAFGDHRLL
jgi:hypothetical protein